MCGILNLVLEVFPVCHHTLLVCVHACMCVCVCTSDHASGKSCPQCVLCNMYILSVWQPCLVNSVSVMLVTMLCAGLVKLTVCHVRFCLPGDHASLTFCLSGDHALCMS